MTLHHRAELTNYLRDHIVGALHVGELRSGDRLPSIRTVAAQFGKNPRTVKAAYHELEKEGLVEVRGRSGVFVARQEVLGGDTTREMARWLAGVIAEAWKRRVQLQALGQLLQRATALTRVRCGLVEYVHDSIVALRHELEVDWGFEVRVVEPDSVTATGDVDFFAATSFCAPQARDAAAALGKPLVVLTIHAGLQQAVRNGVRAGRLTVVAVDPRFVDRVRVAYAADETERDRIRVVLASDRDAVEALDPDEPVLLTRAARERLGTVRVPSVYPHSPTLSIESAHALANVLVRTNLNAHVGSKRAHA